MPIGRDRPKASQKKADPVVEAQMDLIANPAVDPKELLAADAELLPVAEVETAQPPHPAAQKSHPGHASR